MATHNKGFSAQVVGVETRDECLKVNQKSRQFQLKQQQLPHWPGRRFLLA